VYFLSSLLFLIPSLLFAQLQLQQSYCFDKEVVTLGDFSKEINSSEPFYQFPSHVRKFQIQSGKILQALEAIDINASSRYSIIELKKRCNDSFPKEELKDLFAKELREYHKSIKIRSIDIEPKNDLRFPIEKKNIKGIVVTKQAVKKSNGSFYLLYEKENERRVYFEFKVDAELVCLKANRAINKKETIKAEDVTIELMPFRRLKAFLASKEDLGSHMLKRYVRSGDIIYKRDLSKNTLVRKNSKLKALIIDGGVELFFDVVALRDGDIGDVIEVRKPNGKQYSAIITAKNRVKIK
jgi:flagella basal body P-ring formation protein FlgA